MSFTGQTKFLMNHTFSSCLLHENVFGAFYLPPLRGHSHNIFTHALEGLLSWRSWWGKLVLLALYRICFKFSLFFPRGQKKLLVELLIFFCFGLDEIVHVFYLFILVGFFSLFSAFHIPVIVEFEVLENFITDFQFYWSSVSTTLIISAYFPPLLYS